MNRIALFGGSFDPVHLGHLELVKCAREALDLNQVIFMPCWQSPFKGKTIATGEQRFQMLEFSIEEQGMNDWAETSEYEISRPEPSFSWQTAQSFSSQRPEDEWYWILGTDQWEQIEKWAEPEKLRKLLHFIVITRDGNKVVPREGWKCTSIPFSHPASSTKIRNNFESHKDWLSPEVAKFCESHSIYT